MIERTARLADEIFMILDETGNRVCSVLLRPASFDVWFLCFQSAEESIETMMHLYQQDFTYVRDDQTPVARATHARFSILGKTCVSAADGRLVGKVVLGFPTKLLAAGGKCVGHMRRKAKAGTPWFLTASRAHEAWRYVVNRLNSQPIDRLLLYAAITSLVAMEQSW